MKTWGWLAIENPDKPIAPHLPDEVVCQDFTLHIEVLDAEDSINTRLAKMNVGYYRGDDEVENYELTDEEREYIICILESAREIVRTGTITFQEND